MKGPWDVTTVFQEGLNHLHAPEDGVRSGLAGPCAHGAGARGAGAGRRRTVPARPWWQVAAILSWSRSLGVLGGRGNLSVPVGTWGQGLLGDRASLAVLPPQPASCAASLLGPAGLCRLFVFAAGALRPCPGMTGTPGLPGSGICLSFGSWAGGVSP